MGTAKYGLWVQVVSVNRLNTLNIVRWEIELVVFADRLFNSGLCSQVVFNTGLTVLISYPLRCFFFFFSFCLFADVG